MQMNSKPKLSIIIPAHNAGKFLERCVNSIIWQDCEFPLEILIIENGSGDNTVELAGNLEEKCDQVRLIHSETGVSKARNAGIDEAKGDWIFFLDADDYLPEEVFSIMKHDIEERGADLYLYSYEKGASVVYVNDDSGRKVYGKSEIENCRISMLENPTRYMAVWGKLFKRDIIVRHSLKFKENLRLAEDSDYLIRYTMYCEKIVFCREIAYHYTTGAESTVRTYDGEKMQEYVKSLLATEQIIRTDSERIQNAYRIYVLMHLNVIMVREVFCVENPESFFAKIERMKNVVKVDIFRSALKKVPITACRSSRMLPVLLLKCKLYGICAMAYQMRAKQNYKSEKNYGY